VNQAAALERAVGHLPSSLDEALPYYRDLIARHHAAILAGDGETAIALRHDHPACASITASQAFSPALTPQAASFPISHRRARYDPSGGQEGEFILEVAGIHVLIKLSGLIVSPARHCAPVGGCDVRA
jgi:hypothetical protein